MDEVDCVDKSGRCGHHTNIFCPQRPLLSTQSTSSNYLASGLDENGLISHNERFTRSILWKKDLYKSIVKTSYPSSNDGFIPIKISLSVSSFQTLAMRYRKSKFYENRAKSKLAMRISESISRQRHWNGCRRNQKIHRSNCLFRC